MGEPRRLEQARDVFQHQTHGRGDWSQPLEFIHDITPGFRCGSEALFL